ncbi:PIN domain-containing protein [Polynucleobacter sp. QLW-P1DATA-2]|uniref:PIN domain-containing protein n=1 Tax=unclassified Polynucleobacter TaxID=2640945 RepID=UPI0008F9186F|nr:MULTISPECIES: PIN domain-containing protein [unclassified Polynucleobacter]OIM97772.1 PIN domain-containing protein [Polynucleobacter sp. MWH-Tro8-2-5-gr]OIN03348.1 PIN domain-containing protein [Polynucleobacter sp. QLW-P1DATA-2]
MAGYTRYTAVLDACVLYPVTIANVLMELAWQGIYTAKWTDDIDREWVNSLKRDKPDLTDEKIKYRLDHMHKAIPDWQIPNSKYQKLIPALALPDQDDRHVLAAAIAGHADCIVTKNIKDFPIDIVDEHGIEVLHPDDFILLQLTLDSIASLTVIKHLRARAKNPKLTAEQFIESLEKVELVRTAEYLRQALELI